MQNSAKLRKSGLFREFLFLLTLGPRGESKKNIWIQSERNFWRKKAQNIII
jgi:hypothetical protein